MGIIPPEALGEVFGEDVNPEDLDIDETDGDSDEMPEEDEEDAELLRTMNGNVAYADGCTIKRAGYTSWRKKCFPYLKTAPNGSTRESFVPVLNWAKK